MTKYLLQGFLLGLAYVAPIGTQNIFVINTALTQKRRRVLLTALIVSFFDISLSVACFYGVGALMSAVPWLEVAIIAVGSAVVIWIGVGLLRAKGDVDLSADVDISVPRVIGTACVVTWFNPQAIIDGTMPLGASRAAVPDAYGTAFIVGCASASAVWWFGMSTLVNLFRTKFSRRALRIISLVCGLFLVFYGARLLWSGVQMLRETL